MRLAHTRSVRRSIEQGDVGRGTPFRCEQSNLKSAEIIRPLDNRQPCLGLHNRAALVRSRQRPLVGLSRVGRRRGVKTAQVFLSRACYSSLEPESARRWRTLKLQRVCTRLPPARRDCSSCVTSSWSSDEQVQLHYSRVPAHRNR